MNIVDYAKRNNVKFVKQLYYICFALSPTKFNERSYRFTKSESLEKMICEYLSNFVHYENGKYFDLYFDNKQRISLKTMKHLIKKDGSTTSLIVKNLLSKIRKKAFCGNDFDYMMVIQPETIKNNKIHKKFTVGLISFDKIKNRAIMEGDQVKVKARKKDFVFFMELPDSSSFNCSDAEMEKIVQKGNEIVEQNMTSMRDELYLMVQKRICENLKKQKRIQKSTSEIKQNLLEIR
jgi:hypothetical protein